MASDVSYRDELDRFSSEWEQIAQIPETPRPTLDIIEYSLGPQRKAELYVNRLLEYFLNPTESHGMGDEFLRSFLRNLPDTCNFNRSVHDLSNVTVEDQVPIRLGPSPTSEEREGFVDLIIHAPSDLFLLAEIKFSAGENNIAGSGLSQTEFYYEASDIDGMAKSEYESSEYYLYIHPSDEDEAVSDAFANWTWETICESFLTDFLTTNAPRYPQRTVTQLRELVDNIKDLTGMSERDQSKAEKIELYLDHFEAIDDVTSTFETEWELFSKEWPEMLTESLQNSGFNVDQWTFYQKNSDWGHLFKDGWWKLLDDPEENSELEELPNISKRAENNQDLRISLVHRMEAHLDKVLRDNTLKLHFRNCGSNPNSFQKEFKSQLDERKESINAELRQIRDGVFSGELNFTGNQTDFIRLEYPVNRTDHPDIFEAYLDALQLVTEEILLEGNGLIDIIESAYRDTYENSRPKLIVDK